MKTEKQIKIRIESIKSEIDSIPKLIQTVKYLELLNSQLLILEWTIK